MLPTHAWGRSSVCFTPNQLTIPSNVPLHVVWRLLFEITFSAPSFFGYYFRWSRWTFFFHRQKFLFPMTPAVSDLILVCVTPRLRRSTRGWHQRLSYVVTPLGNSIQFVSSSMLNTNIKVTNSTIVNRLKHYVNICHVKVEQVHNTM